jgi:hypothetical protein
MLMLLLGVKQMAQPTILRMESSETEVRNRNWGHAKREVIFSGMSQRL